MRFRLIPSVGRKQKRAEKNERTGEERNQRKWQEENKSTASNMVGSLKALDAWNHEPRNFP